MATPRHCTRAAAALATYALLVACGGSKPEVADPPVPVPIEKTDPESPIRLGDEQAAPMLLYVSNQSFEDEIVHVTVSIDGVQIVDRAFDVEGQHNWVLFPVELPAGRHTLTAVSDTGVELTQEFAVPERGRRWAVVDYWYYPGEARRFSGRLRNTPSASPDGFRDGRCATPSTTRSPCRDLLNQRSQSVCPFNRR